MEAQEEQEAHLLQSEDLKTATVLYDSPNEETPREEEKEALILQLEDLKTAAVLYDLPNEESLRQEEKVLDEIESILSYKFKNKLLLEEAFTHSSYHIGKCFSYERLEYIGDAILNLLVTTEQYFSYPNLTPGQLTRLRAANVDTEKLARVAIKHGLHRYLRHKKPLLEEQIEEFIEEVKQYPLHSNGLIDTPKNLADIVESTIGAIFIDCDCSIDIVRKILNSLLEPIIDQDTIKTHPVTELYEVCQKNHLKIQFQDVWQQSMTINVLIEDKLIGRGICGTKKEIAFNRAAKSALENIDQVLSTGKTSNEYAFEN